MKKINQEKIAEGAYYSLVGLAFLVMFAGVILS